MRASSFLVPGVAAIAALAFAAVASACGGDDDDASATAAATTAAATTAGTPQTYAEVPTFNGLPICVAPGSVIEGSPFQANANPLGGQETVALSAASADLYVGGNNLAVGMLDKATQQPIGGANVRLTIYEIGQGTQTAICQVEAVGSAPGTGEESEHLHPGGVIHIHGGEDSNRAVHYAHVDFSKPGNWGLVLEAILDDGSTRYGTLLIQVAPEPATPAPGENAIKSDNLTKADVTDIREIDSGSPPNDMHDFKIREVIDAGRPAVVVFSTPAYCSTAFCGPVNEEVEELQDIYRDRVDFIHIEIYRDFSAGTLNPTAREWLVRPDGSLNEPVVYVIGKDGVIFDRWDGPVARNIMEASIEAVAGGAVYSH